MRIYISRQQATLLLINKETNEHPELIVEMEDRAYVEGTEEQIEDLRDRCTDLLMRIGFHRNDEPTAAGLLIEDLIDKLYLG